MKRTNKALMLTIVFSVIIVAQGFAQTLRVEGIRALPNDLSASVYQRNDYNGTPCALIKVAFPRVGAAFEGNVVGKTEYKAGEYWVYMTANSKFLKLKHAEHSPLMIQFDDNTVGPVESKRVYGVKVSTGVAKQPVTFKITPSNAILTVDQKECATTNGIAEIMLSPEEHTYVVFSEGYKTQGSKFMVYENNTNKIIIELEPKPGTTSSPTLISVEQPENQHEDTEIVQFFEVNEEEIVDDEPFIHVEQMPSFQGGDLNTFRNWVQKNVRYPEIAAANSISGKVILNFVIERDGSLTNIKVLYTPDKSLSEEAIRVLKQSPKWAPGRQGSNTVRVSYNLPVDFRIQQ